VIFDRHPMTHKRLCLELTCLLVIAVVIPRHSFKIAATRYPRFLPCSSAGTSNAFVNLDSLATPAQAQLSTFNSNKESKDKTRRELIASFLVSEGEYLGSFEWNITEISHTVYSTSYKCTQIGRPGKSVFLKHLDRPPVDGKDNRLRYEFEGSSMRLRVSDPSYTWFAEISNVSQFVRCRHAIVFKIFSARCTGSYSV
jgi:hypothetical protein